MNNVAIFLFSVALLTVSGCATLNEAECVAGDWRGIGTADGLAGRPTERFSRHVEACAKHSVHVDWAQYLTGWERGIERFCTAPNGFRQGLRGAALTGVCPSDLAPEFMAGHRDGRTLYLAEQTAHSLESDLAAARSEVTHLSGIIKSNRHRLRDDSLNEDERCRIEDTIDQSRRLRRVARGQVEFLYGQSFAARDHSESLRSSLVYVYGLAAR